LARCTTLLVRLVQLDLLQYAVLHAFDCCHDVQSCARKMLQAGGGYESEFSSVCRPDGELSCQDTQGVTLRTQREELTSRWWQLGQFTCLFFASLLLRPFFKNLV
jgi:hypothetical protein